MAPTSSRTLGFLQLARPSSCLHWLEHAGRAPPPAARDEAGEDDIAAQVGAGSLSADLALDAAKEACEADILRGANLVGAYALFVAGLCHSKCVPCALRDKYLLRCFCNLVQCALLCFNRKHVF